MNRNLHRQELNFSERENFLVFSFFDLSACSLAGCSLLRAVKVDGKVQQILLIQKRYPVKRTITMLLFSKIKNQIKFYI